MFDTLSKLAGLLVLVTLVHDSHQQFWRNDKYVRQFQQLVPSEEVPFSGNSDNINFNNAAQEFSEQTMDNQGAPPQPIAPPQPVPSAPDQQLQPSRPDWSNSNDSNKPVPPPPGPAPNPQPDGVQQYQNYYQPEPQPPQPPQPQYNPPSPPQPQPQPQPIHYNQPAPPQPQPQPQPFHYNPPAPPQPEPQPIHYPPPAPPQPEPQPIHYPPPAPYPATGAAGHYSNIGQYNPLPSKPIVYVPQHVVYPQPAPLPIPVPAPLPVHIPVPVPIPAPLPPHHGVRPGGFPIQQPTITNTGETIIETLVGGIPFDCAGRPSGHWRDGKFCDIFHACVFGYQRKTYACPFSYGERTYFSEITRRCEFVRGNAGCVANVWYH